jgi:hypothetical protein
MDGLQGCAVIILATLSIFHEGIDVRAAGEKVVSNEFWTAGAGLGG